MLRRLVLALSLGAALLPARVLAQAKVAVRVIDARSHVVHTLVAASDELPAGRCTGNCTLLVEPGDYYLIADDEVNEEVEQSRVHLEGDTVLEVHHRVPARVNLGRNVLALGALAGGLGLLLRKCETCGFGAAVPTGMLLGGLVGILSGATLAASGAGSVEARPTTSVAIAPTRAGAFASFTVVF